MRLGFLAFAAMAVAVAGTWANAGTVVNLPSLGGSQGLRTYGGTATSINVDGYSAPNDGGGGEFLQVGNKDDGSCAASVADDDGVIIVESTVAPHKCWYRQFSGPVHLSWYGVKDAAQLSCYDTLLDIKGCAADSNGTYGVPVNNAFNAAAQSAHLGGDGGVVTDGRSIVIQHGDLVIPSNQYFSCSGPPGGARPQPPISGAIPYYTLPNSIVLGAGHTIKRSANSVLFNCIVRPTWYNKEQLALVTDTRSLIDDIEHKFAGTATMCGVGTASGEACDMHDMFILGFDVCDDSNQSPRTIIRNINMECNVGEYIHNNGGGMKLENLHSHAFIEGGMDAKNTIWPISGIANVGGEVQLSFSPFTASNHPIDGDTILVTGVGADTHNQQAGPQAQNNRWIGV